ncbi:MAG: hypothetical protein WCZ87_09120 [Thiohalobacteraceae bacterium]
MRPLGTDAVQDQWRNRRDGAAERIWDESSENALLEPEEHAYKSLGPVRERYAILGAEADAQIRTFFEKNKF